MKFLCVSDQIDPLVYSSSVKERYGDVDAVFCAGDLSMEYVDFIVDSLGKPTFFVFGNHDLKEYKYYRRRSIFDNQMQNFSESEMMNHSHGADYASNRVIRCRTLNFCAEGRKKSPLLVCGVSGSLKYNNGQAQFTENQMKWQLFGLIPGLVWNKIRYGRFCDVFLTHASPRHIHDKEDPCHKGFDCFNWFIKKFSPGLMVHGHIHLYDLQAKRVTVLEKTTVINAYNHLVVDYEIDLKKGDQFGTIVHIRPDR